METVRHRLAFKAIVACDIYGTIGDGVKMPWDNLEGDLPRFKALTTGKAVVMGRGTFESLPMFPKGLPGRTNYVLTSKVATILDHDASKTLLPHVTSVASDTVRVFNNDHDLTNTLMNDVIDGKITPDVWIIGGNNVWKTLHSKRNMTPLITRGLGTTTPTRHQVNNVGIDEVHLSLVHTPQKGSVCAPLIIQILTDALLDWDWTVVSQEDHLQSNPPYTYYHLKAKG